MSFKVDEIKIANTLIYLRSKLPNLYLTKALKLLYILDETSTKEIGVPFTWLEYKAWEKGPVPVKLYEELQEKLPLNLGNEVLSKYISVSKNPSPEGYNSDFIYSIEALEKFDDDEFSEYEIELMDRVIDLYGNMTASEIIKILHANGSLWHNVVSDNKLQLQFDLMHRKSDVTIPFTELIADDILKQFAYKSAYESLSINSDYSI